MLDLLDAGITYGDQEEVTEVRQLAESIWQFYLTGSNYFETANPYGSDIDLVVEYSNGVEDWLQDQGYELLSNRQNPYFEDQCVMAVYRKWLTHNWIDIQLSTDITKKLLIQEILKKSKVFTMGGIKKNQAMYVWRAMYMLYE